MGEFVFFDMVKWEGNGEKAVNLKRLQLESGKINCWNNSEGQAVHVKGNGL